jgi:hypothetical protein
MKPFVAKLLSLLLVAAIAADTVWAARGWGHRWRARRRELERRARASRLSWSSPLRPQAPRLPLAFRPRLFRRSTVLQPLVFLPGLVALPPLRPAVLLRRCTVLRQCAGCLLLAGRSCGATTAAERRVVLLCLARRLLPVRRPMSGSVGAGVARSARRGEKRDRSG